MEKLRKKDKVHKLERNDDEYEEEIGIGIGLNRRNKKFKKSNNGKNKTITKKTNVSSTMISISEEDKEIASNLLKKLEERTKDAMGKGEKGDGDDIAGRKKEVLVEEEDDDQVFDNIRNNVSGSRSVYNTQTSTNYNNLNEIESENHNEKKREEIPKTPKKSKLTPDAIKNYCQHLASSIINSSTAKDDIRLRTIKKIDSIASISSDINLTTPQRRSNSNQKPSISSNQLSASELKNSNNKSSKKLSQAKPEKSRSKSTHSTKSKKKK